MTTPMDELLLLAEAQHGLVLRRCAVELGIDRYRIRRMVAAGQWDLLPGGVLRRAGSPRTPEQLALAAVLAAGPGAALSHGPAAALWGAPGFELTPPVVTIPRGRHPRPEIEVRTTSVWPEWHRTVHRGITVTTAARTVADLAGHVHPGRVERALDTLWAKRLLAGEELGLVLAELQRRGRRGITVLRQLLAERGPGYTPPESRLEHRFVTILARAGDPPFERQAIIADDDGPIGRVDFLDQPLRLIVEIDSDRFHSSLVDRRNDARRDDRTARAGFTTLRIAEHQLVADPGQVLARVRAARREARRRAA
jgi:very-short-patch-repair endonuclease